MLDKGKSALPCFSALINVFPMGSLTKPTTVYALAWQQQKKLLAHVFFRYCLFHVHQVPVLDGTFITPSLARDVDPLPSGVQKVATKRDEAEQGVVEPRLLDCEYME